MTKIIHYEWILWRNPCENILGRENSFQFYLFIFFKKRRKFNGWCGIYGGVGGGDGGMRGQRSMPKPSPASILWNIKGPTLPTTVGLEHACHVACSPCAFYIYRTFAMSVVGPNTIAYNFFYLQLLLFYEWEPIWKCTFNKYNFKNYILKNYVFKIV